MCPPCGRAAGTGGTSFSRASGGLQVAAAGPSGYRVAPALPGSACAALAVADVTNSGELDLLSPGALWVRGPEGFRKTTLPPGERVAVFDFDSDGDLDVYVSAKSGDRLLRNNLDGSWTDVTAGSGLPAGLSSTMSVAADFDRDGDVDLLVVSVAAAGSRSSTTCAGGRFAEKEAGLPKTGVIRGIAAGDLNADGRLDLVWTSEEGAFVSLNRGDGTFLPPRRAGRSGRHAASFRFRQRRLPRSSRGESLGAVRPLAGTTARADSRLPRSVLCRRRRTPRPSMSTRTATSTSSW